MLKSFEKIQWFFCHEKDKKMKRKECSTHWFASDIMVSRIMLGISSPLQSFFLCCREKKTPDICVLVKMYVTAPFQELTFRKRTLSAIHWSF